MTKQPRSIFISGGTRGIGRAICLKEAGPDTLFFLNYLRDDSAAEDLKKEVEKKGAQAILLPGNVADTESLKGIFDAIRVKCLRLDALVHCAALGVFKPVSQLRQKDWDISMDVNAKAFLIMVQEALGLMKAHGGKIVTISSLGSHKYTPNYGAIGISKAALENLVRYLAVELSVYKISVNAVSGGLIETDSLKMFPDFEKMKKEYLSRVPGARIGRPEDIADIAHFLLSPGSDWIAGQTIIADGGYSLA